MIMKSDHTILADEGIFRKFYLEKHDAEQERLIFNKRLSIIPRLIATGSKDSIEYNDFEYVESSHLWQLDNIDFQAIAELYCELHQLENKQDKVICQIDTNPRNIIYDKLNGRYYLIDFVDWRWEYPEFDLIHFLLFWAEVVSKVEFDDIQQSFLKSYKLKGEINSQRWGRLYPQVVHFFEDRRKLYGKSEKKFNPDQKTNRNLLSKLM